MVDGNVTRLISRILGIVQPIDNVDVLKRIHAFVFQRFTVPIPLLLIRLSWILEPLYAPQNSPNVIFVLFIHIVWLTTMIRSSYTTFKNKKPLKKIRYFHYFDILLPDDHTVLVQRSGNDIWKKLFQYPMIESDFRTYALRRNHLSMYTENFYPFH